jgi:1,4-alpha-glucan branching enzyme
MAQKKKSSKKQITFRFSGDPHSTVYLAGSFTGWDAGKKQLRDKNNTGDFTLRQNLDRDRHLYKFIVDGSWINDPHCDLFEEDGHGGVNSVLDLRDA